MAELSTVHISALPLSPHLLLLHTPRLLPFRRNPANQYLDKLYYEELDIILGRMGNPLDVKI